MVFAGFRDFKVTVRAFVLKSFAISSLLEPEIHHPRECEQMVRIQCLAGLVIFIPLEYRRQLGFIFIV